MQIAIDGPAGAGKSTIAKELARILGFMYVDTGAMYRTAALSCLKNNIDFENEDDVSKNCDDADIKIIYEDGVQKMFLDGVNVSEKIRREEVGNAASKVAKYPGVRKKLVKLQQELAKKYDVIMDGRDIGTMVLPDAQLKIYLTASVEKRAERRFKELLEKGLECRLEEIEKDIEQRDYNDMHRKESPLKKAADAIEVDTSDMTIVEVTEAIKRLYEGL